VKICLQPQISENNIPDFTCLWTIPGIS
jgi:hypothetical protein